VAPNDKELFDVETAQQGGIKTLGASAATLTDSAEDALSSI